MYKFVLCSIQGWYKLRPLTSLRPSPPLDSRSKSPPSLSTRDSAQTLSRRPTSGRHAAFVFSRPPRKLVDLSLGALRQGPVLPRDHSPTNIAGMQSQGFTDAVESEYSLAGFLHNPTFRLAKQSLAFAILGEDVLLKTRDGVFQNRQHELFFRLQMQLAPERIEILIRQKRVRLKQRGYAFFHAKSGVVTHNHHLPLGCGLIPDEWKNHSSCSRRTRKRRRANQFLAGRSPQGRNRCPTKYFGNTALHFTPNSDHRATRQLVAA